MRRPLFAILIFMAALGGALTEDGDMEQAWSKNQQNVLRSTLIDQERIATGELLPSEVRLMKIIDAVERSLNQKYPDATFAIQGLQDIFFQSECLTLHVKEADGTSFFVTTVSKREDLSDLTITDGYYAIIKVEEMNLYVQKLLTQAGALDVKTAVWIYGSFGPAFAAGVTPEDVGKSGLSVSIAGDVFMPALGNEHIDEKKLKAALRKKGVMGVLNVWKLKEMPSGEASARWVKRYCSAQGIAPIRIAVQMR